MRLPRSLVLLTSALLLPCCITSSPAEYGATPAAKKASLPLCADGLVEDMEDGDAQVIKIQEREGYWFTFVDAEGSTVSPRGQFQMFEATEALPGRPGEQTSTHYARMTGKLAESGKSIYSGIGFSLSNPKGPFDVSAAKGIQFWARGPGKVRFKTPDINTDPAGDRCSDCYNDFGVDIYLSDRWERYTVPFEAMEQQPGWGDRAPYVARGAIMAIQWQFGTRGESYDISIDDVALVGCEVAAVSAAASAEARVDD